MTGTTTKYVLQLFAILYDVRVTYNVTFTLHLEPRLNLEVSVFVIVSLQKRLQIII